LLNPPMKSRPPPPPPPPDLQPVPHVHVDEGSWGDIRPPDPAPPPAPAPPAASIDFQKLGIHMPATSHLPAAPAPPPPVASPQERVRRQQQRGAGRDSLLPLEYRDSLRSLFARCDQASEASAKRRRAACGRQRDLVPFFCAAERAGAAGGRE
jgi:hypothetical protein